MITTEKIETKKRK